jgi:hypothetical protein
MTDEANMNSASETTDPEIVRTEVGSPVAWVEYGEVVATIHNCMNKLDEQGSVLDFLTQHQKKFAPVLTHENWTHFTDHALWYVQGLYSDARGVLIDFHKEIMRQRWRDGYKRPGAVAESSEAAVWQDGEDAEGLRSVRGPSRPARRSRD